MGGGDLNARATDWDTITNRRGKALFRCIERTMYMVTAPNTPTYKLRVKNGSSTPDIQISNVPGDSAVALNEGLWQVASDHHPVLFSNSRWGSAVCTPRSQRTPKTRPQFPVSSAKFEAIYESSLPVIVERLRVATPETARSMYTLATAA